MCRRSDGGCHPGRANMMCGKGVTSLVRSASLETRVGHGHSSLENLRGKLMLKTFIRKGVRLARHWLDEDSSPREVDPHLFEHAPTVYPWLNALCMQFFREDPSCMRPAYLWGVLHGAHLAKTLGIPAISLIEFGVAGGNGLIALERIAERVERTLGMRISVYGFDTGGGLPPPKDVRDCPNLFTEGGYPMAAGELRKRLRTANLILGMVEETLPVFAAGGHPDPVAFIAFDLDYYSSTKAALHILESDAPMLLPRVHCYFDDITGHTYSDYNGERLAISEFNEEHPLRKISPIYGLRHYVPTRWANALWTEKYYMAHLFDHELYSHPDGLVRRARRDL